MAYYTPITVGAGANSATINTPLSQLDAQLVIASNRADAATASAAVANTQVDAARSPYTTLKERLDNMTGGYSGGNIATLTDGVAAAGQKVVTVDSTTGFLAGAYVSYALAGGAVENNLIATVDTATQLTLTTNIGTGGIANNVYIGMISVSEYQAANTIPHSDSLTLPQAIEYTNRDVYNVRSYHASPSATATVNAAAFNAALTAAAASTKGSAIVDVPPGRYLIDAALVIPSSVELRGAGADTTEIVITHATANAIYSSGTSLIRIRDLMIWSQNQSRSAGAAIRLENCSEVLIEHCRIYDCYRPGYFTGCTNMWIEHIRIGHHANEIFAGGFYFTSCIDTHIHNIMVNLGSHVLAYPEGLFVFDSNNDTIEMLNSGAGASSAAVCGTVFKNSVGGGFASRWIRMINCFYEGGHGDPSYGFNQFSVVIEDATNAIFTNCYFASGYGGVSVNAGTDIRFVNSIFLNNATNGAYVTATGGVDFTGCTFDGNSQLTTNTYAHLTMGAGVVATINDNYFGDKIGTILGLTKIAKYAIENSSVGTNIQLGRNTYGTFGTTKFGGSQTINGAVPFAAQDATPSVNNGTLFQTANASPTIITMFDDGIPGQLIRVLIQDSNTIVDFTGGNLKGNAGADWSAGAYDWLEAVFDGTNWYCSIHDC